MTKKNIPLMRREKYMSWDTYFMSIAYLSSFRSKDKHTRNGACIAGVDKKVLGIGYNGLPVGLSDSYEKFWLDDDNDVENSRHSYVVHAEKNAIFNSNIASLKNATIYVPQIPCNICAQAIIQVGIKKVVYIFRKEHTLEHRKRNSVVEEMFKHAKVELINFYDLDLEDKDFIKKLENLDSFYEN